MDQTTCNCNIFSISLSMCIRLSILPDIFIQRVHVSRTLNESGWLMCIISRSIPSISIMSFLCLSVYVICDVLQIYICWLYQTSKWIALTLSLSPSPLYLFALTRNKSVDLDFWLLLKIDSKPTTAIMTMATSIAVVFRPYRLFVENLHANENIVLCCVAYSTPVLNALNL